MNPRRVCAVISGLLIVASACSTEGTAEIDASSRGDVAIGQPSQDSGTAATVDPAPLPSSPATTMPPTTTIALYTTTTTTSQEEVVVQGGPGVNHEVFMAALAPLIEAENAMHAFEAEWDAGMTYSETFRGWREVKAIVAESFDEFAFPEDASTEQLLARHGVRQGGRRCTSRVAERH